MQAALARKLANAQSIIPMYNTERFWISHLKKQFMWIEKSTSAVMLANSLGS